MLHGWVKQTAMQESGIRSSCWKNTHPMMFTVILFTDEKILTVSHRKPTESPTVRNCSNQEERRRNNVLAHTIIVWSPVGESKVVDNTPIWYLWGLVWSINRNLLLLQQFLSVMRWIWNEFFMPRCTGRLRQLTFFTRNFARCWPILKILSKQTRQNHAHLNHVAMLACDVSLSNIQNTCFSLFMFFFWRLYFRK